MSPPNLTPKEAATEVLNQFWKDERLPVNLHYIAEAMGVNVIESVLSPDCSGVIIRSAIDNIVNININKKDALVRKRFTLAHELGHLKLGHLSEGTDSMFRMVDTPKEFYSDQTDIKERDANNFAIELLTPEDAIKFLILKRNMTSIEKLTQCFGISKIALNYRLKNLGLVL